MGFWSSIAGPRVREITPPKKRRGVPDQRPATSSGVRTVRKTPSLDDDEGRELNVVESLLTTNIIEPPPSSDRAFDEKKAKRRSRGLSLSRSKADDGLKRRRSLFGGSKEEAKEEEVPDVPTLPTLSAIYSRQAPHQLNDVDRPSTAVSAITSPTWSTSTVQRHTSELPAFAPSSQPRMPPEPAIEIFELPAELPASTPTSKAGTPAKSEVELKKSRRRSLGGVLSGKRSRSMASCEVNGGNKSLPAAPVTPALLEVATAKISHKSTDATSGNETVRSRRNSNASVASKATNFSRKSRRKSWFQRGKRKDEEVVPLPPLPVELDAQTAKTGPEEPSRPGGAAFSTGPLPKQPKFDDDAASIRTTRSEKAIARTTAERSKSKKRPQSTASHIRRKRKSWWASSNPDDSDDDSNPLPPVPLLIRSNNSTPESSPANSNNGDANERAPSYIAVRGDDIKAPRPLSTASSKSRAYTPRSAAKSFLVSTTPVSDNVRKSVRHSLHNCEDLDSGFENDRGTYCLSAEQQREWQKLKHLMAVMDRRRDATRKTFGEASVAEMFPATPGDRIEEKEGIKFSNRDALAALEVGVAK